MDQRLETSWYRLFFVTPSSLALRATRVLKSFHISLVEKCRLITNRFGKHRGHVLTRCVGMMCRSLISRKWTEFAERVEKTGQILRVLKFEFVIESVFGESAVQRLWLEMFVDTVPIAPTLGSVDKVIHKSLKIIFVLSIHPATLHPVLETRDKSCERISHDHERHPLGSACIHDLIRQSLFPVKL